MIASVLRNRRQLVLPLALGLASLAAGCGASEPQVTAEFPAPPKATPYDPNAPLAKGQPKNTSAGINVDPATGRPMGR